MEREILFRGMDDNKRLIQGYFFQIWEDCFILWGTTNGVPNMTQVDPATVGQFTGLVDRTGKKIFEGDVVEAWSQGVKAQGVVQKRIDGLWIIYPAYQKNIIWGLCPEESGETNVTVIGNIHDNPELVKEEAE